MNTVYAVLVAVYGVVIGSFLNVCIYRIPAEKSIVFGRSSCANCGTQIKWYDLIPVLSYIILGGKCRSCGRKISMQYPLVELANGTAWLCIYIKYGNSLNSLFYCVLVSLLIVISVIDYKNMIIPDGLILITLFSGVIFAIFSREISFMDRLIGFFAASIPVLILALITNGFGGGDIKLLAAAGFFIGWKLVVLGLLIGIICGAFISCILIALKIKGRKDFIPFGPFLAIGFYFAVIQGSALIDWYLSRL